MEYQQIAASWLLSLFSTVVLLWEGVLERRGEKFAGLVFGTLLGPEATGPGGRGFSLSGFVCFWFPGCIDHARISLCGVVCGVCGLGLLFENYIVDASIFYKKQFPRI